MTSSTKIAIELAPLVSVAVMVIAEVPLACNPGTACKDRFVPVPVISRVSFGMTFVFAEIVVITRLSTGESASITVKGTSIEVSSAVA